MADSEGYKAHVFICTNSPDKSGKCGGKGSEDLRKELKEKCKGVFGKDVRVNSSGCLGVCERGIAAVIYPQNKWYLDLTKHDADFLFGKVCKQLKKSEK